MTTLCTCLSGKTICDCQVLESITSDGININRKDMTKEEIEQAAIEHCNLIDKHPRLENPMFSFKAGVKWASDLLQSENKRLKSELLGNPEQLKAEMDLISCSCKHPSPDIMYGTYCDTCGFDLPQPPKQ